MVDEFRDGVIVGRALDVVDNQGLTVLSAGAAGAVLTVGTEGKRGRVRVQNANGTEVVRLDDSGIKVQDSDGHTSIHIDPNWQTITSGTRQDVASMGGFFGFKTPGSSYAVRFRLTAGVSAQVGMVVSINSRGGTVSPTEEQGDRKVVGVVAHELPNDNGAGVVATQKLTGRTVDVTVAGVVMCLVDASSSPIEAGDLLIPSRIRGHAMRGATYPDGPPRNGAILGKALAPLRSGRGTIPILVSLG
jgi:hypothetical protein